MLSITIVLTKFSFGFDDFILSIFSNKLKSLRCSCVCFGSLQSWRNDWEIWEIFSSSILLWELNFHTSHCLWPPLGEWKLIYWKDLICNKRIQAQKHFWLNSKIIELENYINQKFRSKMRIEIITDIIMLLSFLTFKFPYIEIKYV